MRHRTQSGSAKQIPLAFNPTVNFDWTSDLRTAYTRLALSRRLSFEQAMSNRAYAIGVCNLADAIARRGACGNSRKSSSSVNAIAQKMEFLSDPRQEIKHSGAEKGEH